MIVFKKGHCCVVRQGKYEPYDSFLIRSNFIVSQKFNENNEDNECNISYNDILTKSYVFSNINNGLIYKKELMDKIEEMANKM